MVCHVVKINSDRFLLKEIDALDTDLGVLCLLMILILFLLLQFLLLTTVYLFLLRLHSRPINTASLVGFIDLRRDYLFQPHIIFFSFS